MKKIFNYAITAALVIAFATPVFASSTKCSHRAASSSNDLFKSTNPPAKNTAHARVRTKTKSVRATR